MTKKTEPLKRKNILRPERSPWPTDPEFLERCRQNAEDCDEIWRGHSLVILNAMSQAFCDGDKDEGSVD
ncbi:MAG: hypothetical protein ABII72_03855 [Parcubacteria group bacterium]